MTALAEKRASSTELRDILREWISERDLARNILRRADAACAHSSQNVSICERELAACKQAEAEVAAAYAGGIHAAGDVPKVPLAPIRHHDPAAMALTIAKATDAAFAAEQRKAVAKLRTLDEAVALIAMQVIMWFVERLGVELKQVEARAQKLRRLVFDLSHDSLPIAGSARAIPLPPHVLADILYTPTHISTTNEQLARRKRVDKLCEVHRRLCENADIEISEEDFYFPNLAT